jgi:hypothetical protein
MMPLSLLPQSLITGNIGALGAMLRWRRRFYFCRSLRCSISRAGGEPRLELLSVSHEDGLSERGLTPRRVVYSRGLRWRVFFDGRRWSCACAVRGLVVCWCYISVSKICQRLLVELKPSWTAASSNHHFPQPGTFGKLEKADGLVVQNLVVLRSFL